MTTKHSAPFNLTLKNEKSISVCIVAISTTAPPFNCILSRSLRKRIFSIFRIWCGNVKHYERIITITKTKKRNMHTRARSKTIFLWIFRAEGNSAAVQSNSSNGGSNNNIIILCKNKQTCVSVPRASIWVICIGVWQLNFFFSSFYLYVTEWIHTPTHTRTKPIKLLNWPT